MIFARSYFVFMHGFDHSHGPVGALQDAPAGTTCPALPRLRCSTCRAVGSPLVAWFGASSQRGFAATNCITVEGFLQRSQRHSKKLRGRGGSQAVFSPTHMNRHNNKPAGQQPK
jgi:hypothetical protein